MTLAVPVAVVVAVSRVFAFPLLTAAGAVSAPIKIVVASGHTATLVACATGTILAQRSATAAVTTTGAIASTAAVTTYGATAATPASTNRSGAAATAID
jgi:hypothetical protein